MHCRLQNMGFVGILKDERPPGWDLWVFCKRADNKAPASAANVVL